VKINFEVYRLAMVLSKSFGYALRGVLYVSLMKDEQRNISIEEIAARLSVPRHFLGKIMKSVVKAGVLGSSRGQHGGFYVNEDTLSTPLINIVLLIEGTNYFNTCVLNLRRCNADRPCPLHGRVEKFKHDLQQVYSQTTIGDLLKTDRSGFIDSISAGTV
jgi:Rrf2 family protein